MGRLMRSTECLEHRKDTTHTALAAWDRTVARAAPSSPRAGKPHRPKISRALPPTLKPMDRKEARVGMDTSPVQRHTIDKIMLRAVTG